MGVLKIATDEEIAAASKCSERYLRVHLIPRMERRIRELEADLAARTDARDIFERQVMHFMGQVDEKQALIHELEEANNVLRRQRLEYEKTNGHLRAEVARLEAEVALLDVEHGKELATLIEWQEAVNARSMAAGRRVPGEGLCDWFEGLVSKLAKAEEGRNE